MSDRASDSVVAEVRAELGRQGLTGSQLAQRLGKSEMWVSRRLRRQDPATPLTVEDLDRIASALGVPITRFFPAGEPALAADPAVHSAPTPDEYGRDRAERVA